MFSNIVIIIGSIFGLSGTIILIYHTDKFFGFLKDGLFDADEKIIQDAKKFFDNEKKYTRIGLVLVTLGFIFQLFSGILLFYKQ